MQADIHNLVHSFSLAEVFGIAEDARSARGKRYTLSFLLNSTACALMSGAQGFVQIAEWICGQSHSKLRILGNLRDTDPDESTIRKSFTKINLDDFQRLVYGWLATNTDYDALAVDGKTLKATRDSNDKQLHLLSVVTHGSAVALGDRQVDHKASEIHEIRPLLDTIDIRGKTVTADALHSTKDFANYLVTREADYVFVMKGNRKKLINRLEMLDIVNESYSKAKTIDVGHGREETRTLYLMKDLPVWLHFPTAKQAFIIERTRLIKKTGNFTKEFVYGLTSLENADAKAILDLNRGHWTVENKMFYVRDVIFNEDRSTIRKGCLPRFMVALRNLVMSIFRKSGKFEISKAIRECLYGDNIDYGYLFAKF